MSRVWRYVPYAERKVTRLCRSCGAPFETRTGWYCSLAHRPRDYFLRLRGDIARIRTAEISAARRSVREAAAVAARVRTCPRCHVDFIAAHGAARWCSPECKRPVRPARELEHLCLGCGAAFQSVAANARWCSRRCQPKVSRLGPSDLARRRDQDRIQRLRPLVLARDGDRCGLCGTPIDVSLPHASPLALTMDHIVPIALGGLSELANLQPAHRRCNVAKGVAA